MEYTKIYYLHRGDNIPFYVGKSKRHLERLKNHKQIYGSDIEMTIISEVKDWKRWEKYYIKKYKDLGYQLENKNEGGGGVDYTSPQTKKLISKNQPKTKYRNPETNIKIGLSHKGMKKIPCSEERRLKISNTKKGKKVNLGKKYNCVKFKKVIQSDMDGKFIREFDSVSDAQKFLNKTRPDSLYNACRGKRNNIVYGFKWKYKE